MKSPVIILEHFDLDMDDLRLGLCVMVFVIGAMFLAGLSESMDKKQDEPTMADRARIMATSEHVEGR